MRQALSANVATGTERIQHLPAHYLEIVLGKDAQHGFIFPTEENKLAEKRDTELWEHMAASVTKVLRRD
jgi:hypothetical protein